MPVAYLDSASSTQKPRQVLDAMREFYEHSYANVHRGVYTLAERATAGLRGRAREGPRVRQRAVEPRGDLHAQLDRGAEPDRLRVGAREPRAGRRRRDHRARAPRELRAVAVHGEEDGRASSRIIPIDDHGELQLDTLDEIASRGNVKVVANNLVSNTLGTINPVEKLAAWAHEQGAIMVGRRRPGGAAQAHRRAGARLRLPRVLVAQDAAARRVPARCGAAASCSRRCSRSTSAAR